MRVLLALAAVTLLLLCGTAWHVAVEQSRSAGCEMTYMYANYKEVHVQRVAESDKRYKLYLYREDGGPSKQGGDPVPVFWPQRSPLVRWCCRQQQQPRMPGAAQRHSQGRAVPHSSMQQAPQRMAGAAAHWGVQAAAWKLIAALWSMSRTHTPNAAMPPTGHPVLFIPGNAGSYQQVCISGRQRPERACLHAHAHMHTQQPPEVGACRMPTQAPHTCTTSAAA